MTDKSTQVAQARALAAFTDHYGDLGWPMERVEIAEHSYVRFEDQLVDGMWMAFKTGWELSATPAPAETSDQGQGSRTPMNTETAEKPKPVTLVTTLSRWVNEDAGASVTRMDLLNFALEIDRTLDRECSK